MIYKQKLHRQHEVIYEKGQIPKKERKEWRNRNRWTLLETKIILLVYAEAGG